MKLFWVNCHETLFFFKFPLRSFLLFSCAFLYEPFQLTFSSLHISRSKKWMGFYGGSDGKEYVCNEGDPGVWSLGQEDPLEKGMVIHSSILAWRIPWTEEPGGTWGHEESESSECSSVLPFLSHLFIFRLGSPSSGSPSPCPAQSVFLVIYHWRPTCLSYLSLAFYNHISWLFIVIYAQ